MAERRKRIKNPAASGQKRLGGVKGGKAPAPRVRYHFSFKAPGTKTAAELEAFLRRVEADAKRMGFGPTLVLDARFDTGERKDFARRLTQGLLVEDARLKGVAFPATGLVWEHDPIRGCCRLIPERGVVLMVPDARGRETFFGFFRYPPTLRDQNGREIMPTPGANSWLFEDVMENPDPQFRKIVARFAEAGYVEKERDQLAAD